LDSSSDGGGEWRGKHQELLELCRALRKARPEGVEPPTYGFLVGSGVLCFPILKDLQETERGKMRLDELRNATGVQPTGDRLPSSSSSSTALVN